MISRLNSQPILPASRPAAPAAAAAAAAAVSAEPADQAAISSGRVDLAAVLKATAREAASLEQKLPAHMPGELLVKTPSGMALESIELLAADYGATVIEKFQVPDKMKAAFGGELVQLKLPANLSVAQAMAAMNKDERVIYAECNAKRELLGDPVTPNDLDPALWGLNNTGQDGGTADADIDAPEAWALTHGSRSGPVIAVIDTGVDYNHQDLAANIWTNPNEIAGDGIDNDGNGVIDDVHGYNATNDSGDPMDDNDHGSHCSGTIAGRGNNGEGVVGVNWNAQVMGVKFLTGSGSGTLADAIKGVMYASQNGARITSNSWGGGGFNQALKDALAASPALHIFAAGNESNDDDRRPTYPSAFDLDNIVSVAATDHNDQLASFSNYGATTVDLAAPGVDILSSTPGGNYQSFSGTSMATPHVAGVAGLIVSQFPEISNEELKSRLMNSVDKKPQLEGRVASGGRLNAFNALEEDNIAPGAPNDFKATSEAPGGAVLNWTATGDDGWCGQANGYVLRVSDRPIVEGEAAEGQTSFEAASPIATNAPSVTGTIENIPVSLPLSGQERTYHFAMKVKDNVGNLSEIRTTSVTVPAATVAFEDTIDGDTSNWSTESWGQVEVDGRKAWTDSPNGDYGNDQNSSLTTREISLGELRGSTLMFDSKYALENRYDKVAVEIGEVAPPPPQDPGQGGGGQTKEVISWNKVAEYTGSSDWGTNSIDLSAYDGKNVQIRFRLTSDGSVNQDGFYLDNVVIAGDRAPHQPPQQPPSQG
ncbi:MAG: S8 family serine peptidase [Candidatus Eremiobacteraeota bacterium]|nr:S8 family serine peptidase [Candidatus Eremiobacteraeota bacterium]